MLKLLTKTTPWMVASLIVATSVFGEDSCNPCPKPCAPKCEKPCPKPCPQPCPPTQLCPPACPDPCCPPWPVPVLNAAYNYPARITTRCPWDISFDASFIYWQPIQENMEVGFANTTATPFATTGVDGDFINLDFDYKPGFKVGFGWNADYDNWDLRAEYTWFHNTQSTSATAPAGGQIMPTWGSPASLGGNLYNTASESWRLRMDIVDAEMGRWMYVGTKFVVRPYGGARAAWIRQNLDVTYTNTGTLGAGVVDTNEIEARTTSWAIGPRGGMDANWNIGAGFRIFGNTSADILFTRYNRLRFTQTHTAAGVDVDTSQNRYNSLRTHVSGDLGIGWGTYWDCNNWYTDVALGYEFQVFNDQNMFRHFNDDIMTANSTSPNGNLYVHGLTAQFSLNF